MPRYYFDVNEDGRRTSDEDGHDVADDRALDAWAIEVARGIMAAEAAMGRLALAGEVEVRDADRVLVRRVAFSFAIAVEEA